MNFRVAIFAGLVALTPSFVFGVAPQPRLTVPGRVVNIVDGDTLDFEVRLVVRVRLVDGERGVWAPESRTLDLAEKQRGLAAKEHLRQLGHNKDGLLSFPLRSNYLIDYMTLERLLGDVFVGGKSLGRQQIESKNASSTKGGKLGE